MITLSGSPRYKLGPSPLRIPTARDMLQNSPNAPADFSSYCTWGKGDNTHHHSLGWSNCSFQKNHVKILLHINSFHLKVVEGIQIMECKFCIL